MITMCDESDSESDMGNRPVAGKKKNDDFSFTYGNGELSDSDADYKYVSIIDVNPPSPHYLSATENSLHHSIQVNSPVKVNGDVSLNKDEEGVKCSVIILASQENDNSVSRVSVNENFGDCSDLMLNGSSSFLEPVPSDVSFNTAPSFVDLNQNGSSSLNVSPIPKMSSLIAKTLSSESPSSTKALSLVEEQLLNKPLGEKLSIESSFMEESLDGSSVLEGHVDKDEAVCFVREKLKRQRSGSSDYWNHDDSEDHCIVDFLDKISDHAEARLAAKRQARAEAREIRMKELERLQRESEDGDKVYDIYSTPDGVSRVIRAGSVTTPRSLLSSNNSYHSSRRSSEDSLEETNSIRDVRHELKELEEKFRKAMVANAQLDNEKAAFAYQVDLFKDKYEELEEHNLQLLREHKETCRQLDHTRRQRSKLQEDLELCRTHLSELLQLIQEKGLVVVEGDCSSEEEDSEDGESRLKKPSKKALVSVEVAGVLQQGSGSLDVRLKKFVEERNELLDELRHVKLELEEERAHLRGHHANGLSDESEDVQREANKLLGDYKFKLQKAEQDVSTLQANVARLESQVVRYKSAAETSEKLEDELKLEKRKLQRELREAQARVEELETSHSHLQRRLDKLKNAKSALLKDL